MPAMEMRCCYCGTPRDPVGAPGPRVVPTACRCGASFRPMLSTFEAFRRRAVQSRAPWQGMPQRRPNFSIIDCVIDNCRVGIHMEGPTHALIEGLTVVNTPVALELSGGATVNARRVYHSPGPRMPAA